MNALPQRLSLAPLAVAGEPVPADSVLAGAPLTRYASAFTSPDQRFDVGLWESSPGSWRVSYTETEICVLLAGRVKLTSMDGTAVEFHSGDAFLIPAGFEGSWEVLEYARKLYVIYQP